MPRPPRTPLTAYAAINSRASKASLSFATIMSSEPINKPKSVREFNPCCVSRLVRQSILFRPQQEHTSISFSGLPCTAYPYSTRFPPQAMPRLHRWDCGLRDRPVCSWWRRGVLPPGLDATTRKLCTAIRVSRLVTVSGKVKHYFEGGFSSFSLRGSPRVTVPSALRV